MAVSVTKSITIQARLERVLEIERDVESQPQWWPGMLKAEVVEQDENGLARRARFVNEVAKVGRDEFELQFEQRDDGVSWKLAAPTTLQKGQAGDWTFVATGDATEATLSLDLDSSLPMPGFLQKKIIEGMVKGTLAGLKKAAES